MDQSKFEGWAVVELFGHQKIAGRVTTEYFGTACMFRVEVPDLPAREEVLAEREWTASGNIPAGTKVQRDEEPGYTRLIGPGAVYAINPCTEQTIRLGMERSRKKPLRPIDLAPAALPAGVDEAIAFGDDDEQGGL